MFRGVLFPDVLTSYDPSEHDHQEMKGHVGWYRHHNGTCTLLVVDRIPDKMIVFPSQLNCRPS